MDEETKQLDRLVRQCATSACHLVAEICKTTKTCKYTIMCCRALKIIVHARVIYSIYMSRTCVRLTFVLQPNCSSGNILHMGSIFHCPKPRRPIAFMQHNMPAAIHLEENIYVPLHTIHTHIPTKLILRSRYKNNTLR